MAREATYKAIIIKSQPYGEGDEIFTVFTREAGKLRALAKSTKFSRSKLRYNLQVLFLVNLTTTSAAAFPKIIRVEGVKTFPNIRENLDAAKMAYYALELLLKFTADEQKNEQLFDLMAEFLEFADKAAGQIRALNLGMAKFKIEFLESVGLGVHYESNPGQLSQLGFSYSRGGFLFDENALDFQRLDPKVYQQFLGLKSLSFEKLLTPAKDKVLPEFDIKPLQDLLSEFIRFHLERNINSERFLDEENVV